jgi:hypothetical protein
MGKCEHTRFVFLALHRSFPCPSQPLNLLSIPDNVLPCRKISIQNMLSRSLSTLCFGRNERRVPCGAVYAALQGVSGWLLAVRLWNCSWWEPFGESRAPRCAARRPPESPRILNFSRSTKTGIRRPRSSVEAACVGPSNLSIFIYFYCRDFQVQGECQRTAAAIHAFSVI